ncbi:N-acetylglucosamine kinase [Erwinia tasmaniensis]|uniref:N-acetyl-D-glucosamine kinase n=1 Tax=Erwinia tasmaniensis (strain DSM 17950 / CFBP 7177 / CIP 109463 / NCPPB 4357 / Et1/99) TaxID=465817 RepID=NAGK_ERWT9|nr:N-acetylglucosamine kinase [Erwinia tasmaniensis]B2VDQ9.1 RecName: Full=N-acetyl-D-glucosamine kinase; AltName: Full=GlcNAc kinase [Erwinia tasmaniensis Et1/99]CAO97022.1 Putative NAGC-like transcriptional regulator YcfX [Erwinia tasmaniensis Et1/99]
MFYGFDIGGSKIALGVYNAHRQLIWQRRVATPKDDYAQLLAAIDTLTQQADGFCGVRGSVGIGVPGLPIADDGTIFSANIPAARGRTLRADLSARLGREVRIDNDANCFALSEAWDDEFMQYPVVLGMILGTGVGGGLIVDGKPVTGRNYVVGELGHMRLPVDALRVLGRDIPLLPCGCGKYGCIEGYLSGNGFSWLWHYFYQKTHSAPEIIRRYYEGDTDALAHTERYRELLAVCLGNILTLLDPHLVVLGGGLSNFDALYDGLSERVSSHLLPVARPPRFERARHGDAGGMRGAAFLHLKF